MVIAEAVGKDLRGAPVYKRDEEGAELLFENIKKWLSFDENGKEIVRQRKEHVKMLDDDLPEIALNYKKYLDGKL